MRAGLAAGLLGAALAADVAAGEELDVKMDPLHFGAFQEFGSIEKGLLGSTPIQEMNGEWVDHFGTFLLQRAVINDRLEILGGLGGIFQFPKDERTQEEFGGSQYKMFYIGPSAAKAMYHFGGMEGTYSFGGGMFPYNENPDAVNLGSYLFRTMPYPTSIYSGGNGGLSVIGEPTTVLQGFHAQAKLGQLTLAAFLTTETNMPPLYDWSAGLVADWKVADGLLDLGAGGMFKRLIQVKSEKTQIEALGNSYFKRGNTWYTGRAQYYANPGKFLSQQADSAFSKGTAADSARAIALKAKSDGLMAIADSLDVAKNLWVDAATGKVAGAKYYTPAGIILTGRLALDLKKIIPSEAFSKDDMRLYGEIAVLGLENYPVFYENVTERMPIMVGFNVPTFGILDLFAVQMEYFNSPNLNNTYTVGQNNYSVPYLPEDKHFSEKEWNDLTTKDNVSWSLTARKRILGGLSINGQVARDHMRTIGTDWFYGSRFEPGEILHKTSSWYWMFQLGWNL